MLHEKEFHRPSESVAHVLHLQRLRDVSENIPQIDGIHSHAQICVGGDDHPDDSRAKLAGPLQKLNTLLTGHALIGEENADFFSSLLNQAHSFVSVLRRNDPKLSAKSLFEVF